MGAIKSGQWFDFPSFFEKANLFGETTEREVKTAINQDLGNVKIFDCYIRKPGLNENTKHPRFLIISKINTIIGKCIFPFKITFYSAQVIGGMMLAHCRILLIVFPLYIVARFIVSIILTISLVAFAKSKLKKINSSDLESKLKKINSSDLESNIDETGLFIEDKDDENFKYCGYAVDRKGRYVFADFDDKKKNKTPKMYYLATYHPENDAQLFIIRIYPNQDVPQNPLYKKDTGELLDKEEITQIKQCQWWWLSQSKEIHLYADLKVGNYEI